jgi:Na+:H+ antiporter, NhaA family
VVLWLLVLMLDVHATLAGVGIALAIPLRVSSGKSKNATSPLHHLEYVLHPWVAFLVVSIFGFANAGVSTAGVFGRPSGLGGRTDELSA